jgi:hypothetical protein
LLRPRRDLSLDDALLNGGHQRFTISDRQTDIRRPFRHLFERGNFLGHGGDAVVSGDLKQDWW